MGNLDYLGVLCFGLSTVFQLITLPVEFDASRRALRALESTHILTGEELYGARKVLTAAALTYVAALAVSLTQLSGSWLLSTGEMGGNDPLLQSYPLNFQHKIC